MVSPLHPVDRRVHSVALQMALYPIAGMVALVVGGIPRLLFGGGDLAWTAAFLGLLVGMRFETGFEEKNPSYRAQRHWLRLGLCFVGMAWFDIRSQHDAIATAVLVSAIFTVIVHFVLRIKLMRFLWEGMQTAAWLLKAPDPAILKS